MQTELNIYESEHKIIRDDKFGYNRSTRETL